MLLVVNERFLVKYEACFAVIALYFLYWHGLLFYSESVHGIRINCFGSIFRHQANHKYGQEQCIIVYKPANKEQRGKWSMYAGAQHGRHAYNHKIERYNAGIKIGI